MEPKNFQLEVVYEKFPMAKNRIAELYYNDVDFRAACEDYYTCLHFLNKLHKEFSDKKRSIEEYEKIRKELEKELGERIDQKAKSSHGDSPSGIINGPVPDS